jgi:hypothetical protein
MKHHGLLLILCLGLVFGGCAGDESTSSGRKTQADSPADPDRISLGDQRKVSVGELSAADRNEIARAWQQFVSGSPIWRVSLKSIVSRGGAGPYVLSENLFRHFFTASIHSKKSEIKRVAWSAAIIGEPAAAYFAKPLVEDLVPLGKAVIAEVPDPNDPKARIKKTFHHFQIDDFTRRDAARVLVAIGEPAVPTLASPELLQRARPSGRRYAAHALGKIGSDAAVAALERHLDTAPDWQDRAAAVQGLGAALRKNSRVRVILERAAQDPDRFVRKQADEALAGKTKLPF